MSDNALELAGLSRIDGQLCFRGVPVHQMEAWPIALAARLCGLGARTLSEDIAKGLLVQSPHGRVSRDALGRYLNGKPTKKEKPEG